jgi:AraC-like DNA-binding protein
MHLISNKIVNRFLQALVQDGVNLDDIYKSLSIEQNKLSQPGRLLTTETFAKLMRSVYELRNDESAGYTDKPLRLGTFRMMCHATINCSNLRQALLRMMAFFQLLSDEFDWSLIEQGEEAKLSFNHLSKKAPASDFFAVFMLVVIWRWSSWLADFPLLLNRVYIDNSDEGFHTELDSIFKAPIYFNKSKKQLVLPSHYLNLPVKQNSETLLPFLRNSPERLLSHYQSDNSISVQVKTQLELEDSLETISLSTIAEHFNCSAQTLARRLKNDGHLFLELKDKVRKAKAINLLIKSDLSISQISSQLGFSEDSVFYRTFKKWTGLTPKQFRQQ